MITSRREIIMKRRLIQGLVAVAAVMGIIGIASTTKPAKANEWTYQYNYNTDGWNVNATEAEVVTGSAFTYNIHPSEDNTKAWIYNVEIAEGVKPAQMHIPSVINGKTVTRLGKGDIHVFSNVKDEHWDECHSIFGGSDDENYYYDSKEEECENQKAAGKYTEGEMYIEEMTIPDTVTEIENYAFSYMFRLKEVSLNDSIKKIGKHTFFQCRALRKVKLPKDLEELDTSSFDMCRSLEKIELFGENKTYKIMNSCIVKKKDMSAVCCYAKGNQYNIPKGVRILRKHSFANCRAKKVNIPASVKKIEGAVFSYKYWKEFNRDIEDVTVAKNSKYYARDGRTIYNKKDKSLSIAILKSKNGKSTYVMSDKVKFLNANQNVVNYKDWEEPESWDSYKARKKYIVSEYAIYLSKNLKREASGK